MERRRALSQKVEGLASRVEQVEEAWDALHRLRQKLASEAEALHERARGRRTTEEGEAVRWGPHHAWLSGAPVLGLQPAGEHQDLDFWLSAMGADSGSSEARTHGCAEPLEENAGAHRENGCVGPLEENAGAHRENSLGEDGSAPLRCTGVPDAAAPASGLRTQRRRSGGRTPRRHLVQAGALPSGSQEPIGGGQLEKENNASDESAQGKAGPSAGPTQGALAAHNERLLQGSDRLGKAGRHSQGSRQEQEQEHDLPSAQEAVWKQRSREIIQSAFQVLRKLMKHKLAWPFVEPVDAVALNIPDYHDVIECPMDLGTIRDRLSGASPNASRLYESAEEVAADIRLVFDNAKRYNRPETQVYKWACTLRTLFDKMWVSQVEPCMGEEKRHRQMQRLKQGGWATAQTAESAQQWQCNGARGLELGRGGDVGGRDSAREPSTAAGTPEPLEEKSSAGAETLCGPVCGQLGGGGQAECQVHAGLFAGAAHLAGSSRAQNASCIEIGELGEGENEGDSDADDVLDEELAEVALQAEEEALTLTQQAQALRTEILAVKREAASLCREMASGEKCQLAHDISALEPADLGLVVALIRSEEPLHNARRSSGKRKRGAGRTCGDAEWQDEDEMEIHFDALDNSTLWLLRHLVVSLST